ncbi:spore wall synthesis complex protein [Kineococcus sp. NUM-3379]
MPLSDHEQRLLEQMERALSADDPKFASAMRGSHRARAARRRLLVGGVALVVGLVLLVIGVAASQLWVGVGGFVIMLAGTVWAFSPPRTAAPEPVQGQGQGRLRPVRNPAARSGFMARLEERWERRRNQW